MAGYIFGGLVVATVAVLTVWQAIQLSDLKGILRQARADNKAGLERQRTQFSIHLDGMTHGMLRNVPGVQASRAALEELKTQDFLAAPHRRGPFPPASARHPVVDSRRGT